MAQPQNWGELVGPKLQGKNLGLTEHLWIPFNTYARDHLAYKSWHKYPKTFENISEWFRKPISEGGIFSLFGKRHKVDIQPEGVVFHNLKTGQMAKLRRDMFMWSKEQHQLEVNEVSKDGIE